MLNEINNKIKEAALEKVNSKTIIQTLVLMGLAIFLPFFIHLQWLTGPIINAIFILVLVLSGLRAAVLVALIPSIMALSGGLLPIVSAPVIPFIMLSNVIYILFIDRFWNKEKNIKNYWLGVSLGSVFKFLFLFSCLSFLIKLIDKPILSNILSSILGLPQLFSALLGGVIAFVVLKILKKI